MVDLSEREKRAREKRFRDLLQDRVHLTDYERDALIPEIRSRVEVLRDYANDIIRVCDTQKDLPGFTENLEALINPHGLSAATEGLGTLAQRYWAEVRDQTQREYVDDVDELLQNYDSIDDFQTLGAFLTAVNYLCSTFLAVKSRLLLYRIQAYPIVTQVATGQTAAAKPSSYDLATEPFRVILDNVQGVCQATSETIVNWHQETLKLKARFFEYENSRVTRRNNHLVLIIQILTIGIAVALSTFFLTASDPLGLIKRNRSLEATIERLRVENMELSRSLEGVQSILREQKTNESGSEEMPIPRGLDTTSVGGRDGEAQGD